MHDAIWCWWQQQISQAQDGEVVVQVVQDLDLVGQEQGDKAAKLVILQAVEPIPAVPSVGDSSLAGCRCGLYVLLSEMFLNHTWPACFQVWLWMVALAYLAARTKWRSEFQEKMRILERETALQARQDSEWAR